MEIYQSGGVGECFLVLLNLKWVTAHKFISGMIYGAVSNL